MLASLGIGEIIVIVIVAFLILGPQKLPKIGQSFGETIRNFKQAMNEVIGENTETEEDID